MTTSVPQVTDGKPTVLPGYGKNRRRWRRHKIKEDADDRDEPVIPDDAEEYAADSGKTPKSEKPALGKTMEPLIPTSVALVAPDTTPNGNSPLDPSQVPQPAGGASDNVIEPTQPPKEAKPGDVMRTLLGIHQEHFKPAQATFNPMAAVDPDKVVQDVTAMASGMVAAAAAPAKSAAVIEAAMGGAPQPEHKHNPKSGQMAMAAMRSIFS